MSSKKGMTLIMTLVIAVVANIGMAAMLQAMANYSNMKSLTIREVQARYLAEAGMQYALWNCGKGNFSPTVLTTEQYPINITIGDEIGGKREITVIVTYPDF